MDSGRLIRICLVGLPAGLLVIGVASILYTQLTGGPDTEESDSAEKKARAAGIMRKDVNREDLERYVRIFGGDIGERNVDRYENLRTAAFSIESTIGSNNMGYPVRKQKFEAAGKEVWNLIADLPGAGRSDEIIVIGAHYDTAPGSPGANANGTGVAALLSLANAFTGTENGRSLRFVAFVNGEPPFFRTDLMGSLVYARSLENDGANVVAMLALDSIGCFTDPPGGPEYPPAFDGKFPGNSHFIALIGGDDSESLLASASTAYGSAGAAVPLLTGSFSIDVAGWSDHWSFGQAGYPAFMVSDIAPFRDEHYRKPTDTPDRVDFEQFTEVVKGLKSVIETWANP